MFGVVGYRKDHAELQEVLGSVLSELGCVLKFTEGEEFPHDEIITEVKRK